MAIAPRRPLYDEPMSRVLLRVAFQLIRLDARRFPLSYKEQPLTTMLDLAERLRANGVGGFYFHIVSAAKCHQQGIPLHCWRDDLTWPQRDRALHKQRPTRRATR
jgi:hypothetical protein